MDDQSKISFDSTNRLCLVIMDYNQKDSHLTLVSCYSKFVTLLQEMQGLLKINKDINCNYSKCSA